VDDLSGFGYGTGSFITFDDISGLISVQNVPADWTCDLQLVGLNGSNTLPVDSNSVFNATCTYNGPPVGANAGGELAQFTFLTGVGTQPASYYSSEVFGYGSTDPVVNNQVVGLVGDVGASMTTTPEPPTGLLCLTALVASGIFAFARRTRETVHEEMSL
jgi:hypothetical protein